MQTNMDKSDKLMNINEFYTCFSKASILKANVCTSSFVCICTQLLSMLWNTTDKSCHHVQYILKLNLLGVR